MTNLRPLAHFLYGRGFWYATPEREIAGLNEEQLFWVPGPNHLPVLWHAGHIAHRERYHIGCLLQGLPDQIIPSQYEVFGVEWCPVDDLRRSVSSVEDALAWVCEVRAQTHAYIDQLREEDFDAVPPTSRGLSVAHWLFITTAHTALHIGRIQLLRAMIEGKHEGAC